MSSGSHAIGGNEAIRLTIAFIGDNLQLLQQQRVAMTLPPSDPVDGFAGQKGFWYELKDLQDRTLYRRVMHNPMRQDVEAHTDQLIDKPSRREVAQRSGVFVVLVPALETGASVVLSSSPHKIVLSHQPAKEFARISLK